ncbi:MAG: valine--tRNA ligase, partial [Lentibacter algarum]|uniref:valine--tRNA ligase n=1 Tax=Lentibacter algarum TaxID=576131 RepID=UPI003BAF1C41
KEHRRLIPIITDEYPDMNFGSGAVKITGAHDFNDYEVAKRAGIPLYRLMDTKGAMRSDGASYDEAAIVAMEVSKGLKELTLTEADALNLVPDELRGLDRFEARKKVVEQITSEGLAVLVSEEFKDEEGESQTRLVPYVENKPIMQPFGDRSKVVIEPMLTDQWFVDAEKVIGPALDAVRDGEIKIMPESGEKTYYHWLENIEPWCISRQLWWGHQIPVWYGVTSWRNDDGTRSYDLNSRHGICAESEAAAFTAFTEYYGQEPRILASPPTDFELREKWEGVFEDATFNEAIAADATGAKAPVAIYRDPDVLDTWFSSGLWPIGTLGWPEDTDEMKRYFPTDVLVTGADILFFWVARMIMMQKAVVNEIPFHTVYLHQLVRDEKGKKMSKTTGNVIDPLEIVDEFGADALRFTNAQMAALGGVLKLSKQKITGYRNFTTKLWNAARFAEMNEAVGSDGAVPEASATVNKWIIGETAKVRETVDAALEAYRFNDAANALYAFVWGKVCDWYVEFSKPLLLDGDAATKAETQAVMAWVIDQCVVLLHPIMPFITEELWGTLGERKKILAHTDWPTYGSELVDGAADAEMNWVIGLIEEIRSVRAQMHVPAGLKVPVVVRNMSEEAKAAYDGNEALIKKLARMDELHIVAEFPKGTAALSVTGAEFGLPLADIIDGDAETARLEKSLGKLAKEIGGMRGRLGNPKFVESAPDEVVEETRANLAEREEEEGLMKAALKRLAEI